MDFAGMSASYCRFCREPVAWKHRKPFNLNGTDHVPSCAGQKPKMAPTPRDFGRCSKCSDLIVWHTLWTANGQRRIPLNPGDAKQDHRETCALASSVSRAVTRDSNHETRVRQFLKRPHQIRRRRKAATAASESKPGASAQGEDFNDQIPF
jgi:hypothetical protein